VLAAGLLCGGLDLLYNEFFVRDMLWSRWVFMGGFLALVGAGGCGRIMSVRDSVAAAVFNVGSLDRRVLRSALRGLSAICSRD
jgi:hypothetical protein